MKRWFGVFAIAIYLLILSSLFAPITRTSFLQFAKELVIRLAIVAAFATATSIFLNLGTVEPYRITDTSQEIEKGETTPIELQDAPLVDQFQPPPKRKRAHVAFWIAALAIYCMTQTSWWAHQTWVSRLSATLIHWAILSVFWGFIVLLWLPKPDANQPEQLHVVPQRSSKTDLPLVPKSTL